ncbi:peroxidase [Serendipita vermifera MAFF 305830]|uniref:Peroxidase n=1 Tax=Serendipita vermifera MAFF 305830 TaxID=933852 RepID=A0A0C3BGB0_SERVB|nr:peroxidase [Serendipita vermifera MAFF 305830]
MALRSLSAVTPALRVCNSRAFSSIPRGAQQAARRTTTLTAKPFARSSARFYATEPGTGKSGSGGATWLLLGVAVAAIGGGYYVYSSPQDAETLAKSGKQAAKAAVGKTPKLEDYQQVYNKVAQLLDEAGDYDDGSYGPVLVRLAWHASGTYDKETNTGGSNYATMRFNPEALHGANNGLAIARGVLEPLKKEFSWISYGDLWTLAGVAAIQEAGGPKVPWRAGRIDGFEKDVTPDGRLPDAAQGGDHLRNIFYRMGFNDQEIVALAGAHALGRCHVDRSGFEGPWTFSPTSFTNEFYNLLLNEKWQWRKWNGPKQLEDKKTKSLMMLPTDYALIQDKSFKKTVQAYAADESLFFKDFSAAFARLLELGVPTSQWVTSTPWELKTLSEQTEKK